MPATADLAKALTNRKGEVFGRRAEPRSCCCCSAPALLWPLPLQLAGVRRKRAAALPMRWRKAAAAALMNAGLPRASLSQVEHRRDAAHHRPVPATLPQGLGAEQARRGPPVRVTALGGWLLLGLLGHFPGREA